MFPHSVRAWLATVIGTLNDLSRIFTQIYQDTSLNSVTTTSFEFVYRTKLACNASHGHVYGRLFREGACCLPYCCQSIVQFLTLSDCDENVCWCQLIACNWAHFWSLSVWEGRQEGCMGAVGKLRGTSTDMFRLTTGMRSVKCVFRRIRWCTNVIRCSKFLLLGNSPASEF